MELMFPTVEARHGSLHGYPVMQKRVKHILRPAQKKKRGNKKDKKRNVFRCAPGAAMIYISRGGAFGKISIRGCPLEERAGELIVSKRLGMLIRIPGYRERPGDNVGIHHTWKSTICI
jgi:hypothetical protein